MANRYCDLAALSLLGGLLLLWQGAPVGLGLTMVLGGCVWLLINCGVDSD